MTVPRVEQVYEIVRTDAVTLHPDNPRIGDVPAIRGSIAANGFYGALIVQRSTGYVLAGNHRLLAAVEEGVEELPAIMVDADDELARRIMVADNRTSDLGTYNQERFYELLQTIGTSKVELAQVGFSTADFTALRQKVMQKLRAGLEDLVPEPPLEPRSVLGEIYELGTHRLVCGDSTNPDHVALALVSEEPALCVTDPPYGVDYDPAWRDESLSVAERRVGEVTNDDQDDWSAAWALVPSQIVYAWHASLHGTTVQTSLEDSRFVLRSQIIWIKPHVPISRGHYNWRHEACFYAVRKGASASWTGDRKQTTVWETPLDKNVPGGHSTQKPVFLMAKAIANHEGDVYEPFAGSGSTLIAAEQLERRCFAIEISPAYCDVIRQRYADYVGDQQWAP